jgi:hypothetical protein
LFSERAFRRRKRRGVLREKRLADSPLKLRLPVAMRKKSSEEASGAKRFV